MCGCLPKALDFIGKGLFNEILATSDVSATTSSILGQYAELQTCFLDNSFTIQDNKAALLTSGALSTSGGWTVIKAAEIDLATYFNFAADISPCFVGACDPDLIRAFFTNHLQKSQALMSDQLVAFLTPWVTLLDGIKQQLGDLRGAFDSLSEETQTVQSQIDTIRGELCKDANACAEETVTKFYEKISESLALEQEFVKAKDAVEDIVEAITKMVKLVENVLAALDAIPDANSLIQLITSGQLQKVADLGQALRIGKDLPKLVHDLTEALPTVTGFVARLEQQGPKLRDSFANIGSKAWVDDPQVTTAAAGNARASILRIQGIFRGQIFLTVQDVTAKVSGIYGALTNLPFHGRSLSIEVNVASYQRWSQVSFDMPCSRIASKKFTVTGGFSKSFDYPQFYRCPYSNKIEWPNHHVPYIKIRFGGPTALQLASFASFPAANSTEGEGGGGGVALGTFAPTPSAPAATGASFTTGSSTNNGANGTSVNGNVTIPASATFTGGGKVTYFTNGSFAGQFDEVEGEDVTKT
ncbi:MAG: hypothetical protein M1830_002738 [Pleopsidium flavum]|nr:MAG: hypothetical protein M1830_002757 [Pleopsidium flavum]KAI9871565.1 MAG: hypothetical protein M1830_002738 [Pleopsidium flavum]